MQKSIVNAPEHARRCLHGAPVANPASDEYGKNKR